MLPNNIDLPMSVIEKLNKNVYYMIDLFISFYEGPDCSTFLEEIFPTPFLRDNIEDCKKIVLELMEMTIDSYKREYLKPIYEYALYMLIEWWIDVTAGSEGDSLDIFEKGEFITNEGTDFSHYLNDPKNYKEILFDDWDFLNVSEFLEIYNNNPVLFTELFHVDLDEYVELMPNDIRRNYEEKKEEYTTQGKVNFNEEEFIIKSLYNILQLFSMRPRDFNETSEVRLSDEIHDSLKQCYAQKGINIEREARAGFAKTETGELDFFISKFDNNIFKQIAIGENKKWGKFKDSLAQLLGYMDNHTNFGFTIIFNKSTNLNTVFKSRLKILKAFNIEDAFRVIEIVENAYELKNVLRTTHENPEQKGTYFNIYHFVFNIYKVEREKSAEKARTQ